MFESNFPCACITLELRKALRVICCGHLNPCFALVAILLLYENKELGARGKPSTFVYRAEWLVEPSPKYISRCDALFSSCEQAFSKSTSSRCVWILQGSDKTWERHTNSTKQLKTPRLRQSFRYLSSTTKSCPCTNNRSRTLHTRPGSFQKASRQCARKL